MRTVLAFASVALLVGGLTALPAFAAGTDNSGSQVPTCPKGKVYSQQKQMCIDAQSNAIDDKSLTDYAYALAKEGRYRRRFDAGSAAESEHARGAQLSRLRDPQTRPRRRRHRLLSASRRARSRLYAGARISRRGVCDKGRPQARQGAARGDREALRHDLRALRGPRRGDRTARRLTPRLLSAPIAKGVRASSAGARTSGATGLMRCRSSAPPRFAASSMRSLIGLALVRFARGHIRSHSPWTGRSVATIARLAA